MLLFGNVNNQITYSPGSGGTDGGTFNSYDNKTMSTPNGSKTDYSINFNCATITLGGTTAFTGGGNTSIRGVKTPEFETDATNKKYVDDLVNPIKTKVDGGWMMDAIGITPKSTTQGDGGTKGKNFIRHYYFNYPIDGLDPDQIINITTPEWLSEGSGTASGNNASLYGGGRTITSGGYVKKDTKEIVVYCDCSSLDFANNNGPTRFRMFYMKRG